jgi:ASC-1-like (ASCH) protein
MKLLPNVTLIGVDCVDLKRLQLAAEISTKEISFGAVKLLSSIKSNDPRVVSIKPIKSAKEYSDFCIKDLYKYIDTEFALIFQYDGFVTNASAWSDEFLKYDYIGSNWYHLGDLHVGNGGFSLRSKKLIDWLGQNWKKIDVRIHPEDVFICKFARPYLEQEGMRFAPEEVAAKFAMEGTEYCVVWNGQFGVHGTGYTDISKWIISHPEYKGLIKNDFDDYVKLMRKYPIHDNNVYTFHYKKYHMQSYKKLATGQKNYEARITKDKYRNFSGIKIGDTIAFKRSGVSFKDVPIPAFEKKVRKIETFNTFMELRKTYPIIQVSYPIEEIPHWKRPFLRFLGKWAYPKDASYTIFWF